MLRTRSSPARSTAATPQTTLRSLLRCCIAPGVCFLAVAKTSCKVEINGICPASRCHGYCIQYRQTLDRRSKVDELHIPPRKPYTSRQVREITSPNTRVRTCRLANSFYGFHNINALSTSSPPRSLFSFPPFLDLCAPHYATSQVIMASWRRTRGATVGNESLKEIL
ncbi:hypothetical protein E2C01_016311 [Portunus trituberculatus]|uniref:Uncharacterized protein n=1 Tax=Portunus trituberculatus TaxID=210409 RepID=A0A5B7DNR4_PORTR|nr:hypothetical protein [Portunus trituberculatus]